MENNNRNIDHILINKKYNELSAEEFLVIKDEIPTESEYNDLRAMLIAAEKELKSAQEIEPKESTKAFLMNEFSKMHPATRTSAGGLGFLFPKDRAFYQKPGYQLLAVAAVVILIITIFPKLNADMNSNEDVAQHEVKEPKEGISKQKEGADTDKVIDSSNTDELDSVLEEGKTPSSPVIVDENIPASEEVKSIEESAGYHYENINQGDSKDVVSTVTVVTTGDLVSVVESEKGEEPALVPSIEEPLDDMEEMNELAVEIPNTGGNTDDGYFNYASVPANNSENNVNANESTVYDMSISGDSDPMESTEELASSTSLMKNVAKERADKKTDVSPPVKTVKSLAENAELIDLFYTAM